MLYLPGRYFGCLSERGLQALEQLAHDEHRLAPSHFLAKVGNIRGVHPAGVPEPLCQGLHTNNVIIVAPIQDIQANPMPGFSNCSS